MMDELKKIRDQISAHNRTPLKEFDGLTSEEMYHIIYDPFSEQSPVKFYQELTPAQLQQSPIFNIALDLLFYIYEQDGLKLTPKGNLQRKVMKELYAKKYLLDEFIESGIGSIRTEQDWMALHNTKIVLELAGIIRPNKGKLRLVNKWKRKLEKQEFSTIFMQFFKSYTTEFNWAYNDGYENEETGHVGFLFLLNLVKKYGQNFRDVHFYTEKYFRAFPMLAFEDNLFGVDGRYNSGESAVIIRFFERFAERFGFVEIKTNSIKPYFKREKEIRKTKLLDDFIYFSRAPINS